MNLVIVESPAKAKTINKYLGDNYTVLASYGHIRDLPSKNGSVDPDQNFKMEWEVDNFSKKYLKDITDAAKESSKIILATDPDREGEAIAWHVKEYLNEKKLLKDKEVERVVFNEITKKAVTFGIENPRQIEPLLVDAYMARRALDYLVGFNISPILWTKLPGSKSAGRVQSVALKLITEREHEIELFNPEEFWTLSLKFQDEKKNSITASIYQLDGKKIEKFTFRKKEDIEKAISGLKNKKFNISDISSKIVNRNPSGPFTTSTLQQVASSRLGFGASRTMQIAQKLYQGIEIEGDTVGLITYMRTDGTNLSADAISDFRNYIKKSYGNEYIPEKANNYSGKKAKNAQEAHEAIRPTDINRSPETVKKYLSTDQNKLYNLIWSRALSSQMVSAKFDRNTITIETEDKNTVCKTSGSVLKFDGFLKVYKNPNSEDDDEILPEVKKGPINIESFLDEQHFTQPPPRYSEASLVKKLEELGIGRPSTYASIISTISNRGYAEITNKRFFPTDRGKLISAFLEKLFSKYVDYNFTAGLEDQLDEITTGKESWINVLELFWKDFNNNVSEVKEKRTREVLDLLNESLGTLIFDKDDSGNVVRKCQLCANETKVFANYWVHNAFITMSNEKMAKSQGNILKIKDFRNKISGQIIRLALMSAHYKQPLDWNDKLLSDCESTLDKWYKVYSSDLKSVKVSDEILKPLYEDLNTPGYIANLHKLFEKANKDENKDLFVSACKFVGLMNETGEQWNEFKKKRVSMTESEIENMLSLRDKARENKNYKEADRIRDELLDKGVLIEDKDGKTLWKFK